jgi:hypothetical protein
MKNPASPSKEFCVSFTVTLLVKGFAVHSRDPLKPYSGMQVSITVVPSKVLK